MCLKFDLNVVIFQFTFVPDGKSDGSIKGSNSKTPGEPMLVQEILESEKCINTRFVIYQVSKLRPLLKP